MQTIILCGGLGTRLREETEFRPKPMVNIGDRPILWHIMKIYATYGHTEFILPLGYKGNMIRDYFINYECMNNDVTLELGHKRACNIHNCHDESGWKITLANTGENSIKGERIKRIQQYVTDDTFMLTYGDGIADIDIHALLSFHKSHGKAATVTGVVPVSRFGELKLNGDIVESFYEKPALTDANRISGGFFVFNRNMFDYLEPGVDLETGALEQLALEKELMVYRHNGFWSCMDTLRDVEFLNGLWDTGKACWKIWPTCSERGKN